MRKPSRKTLVRNLDHIVSLIVRKRDGRCIVCGTTENLTCGHVFTRSHYSTRWDLENCYGQCAGCNLKHEYDSYPMFKAVIARIGQEAFDALHQRHIQICKLKDYQLQEMLDKLQNLLTNNDI